MNDKSGSKDTELVVQGSLPALQLDAPERRRPPGLLQQVRRHFWLIVAVALVSFAAAASVILNLEPRYRSEATLMIEERQTRIFSFDQVLPQMASDTEAVQTEVRVLLSRSLAEETVDALDLATRLEFNPQLATPSVVGEAKQQVLRYLGARTVDDAAAATPQAARARAVDILVKELRVQPYGRSRAISVAYVGRDPDLTAKVVNTHTKRYLEGQVERKLAANRRAQDFLEAQATELSKNVLQAEAAVETFRNSADLLRIGNETPIAAQQLYEVARQLAAARVRRAEAQARFEQAQDPRSRAALPEVVSNLLVTRLREQEAQLQREVTEVATNLGAEHPRSMRLLAAINNLQKRITQEVDKIAGSLSAELSVQKGNETRLEARLTALRRQAEQGNSDEVQARALAREADAQRSMLQALLTRRQEVSAGLALQQADARVLSWADRPNEPVFPRTLMFLAAAGVGSAGLGLGAALIPRRRSDGLKSMDDVAPVLGARALGLVPAVRAVARSPNYLLRRPHSAYAESIRAVLTNLLLTDVPPRSVAVVSALPDEGKTSISIALAQVAVRLGLRALVVDCDLRRPTLHQRLGLRPGPGVSELLNGRARADEVVQFHEASGVWAVPGGKGGADGAGLLLGNPMRQQLEEWERDFDLVILDTSPLAAVADARLMARACDTALFVALWDSTKRSLVHAELGRLRDLGVRVAGVVLTRVDASSHAREGYSDSGLFATHERSFFRG